ncbi:MAG: OsmC family protein [Bacteroidetes bacterium]|nr:OsmC family protein [Bacteroidota bacterium]
MVEVNGIIKEEHYKTILSNGRHEVIGDEPKTNGGSDLGFSPSDLLCAALATCTCVTLRMYADKKGWSLSDVKANISFTRNNEKNVSYITREIELKGNLSPEQRERLLTIANQCFIHKTLTNPIEIETKLR